MQLRVPADIVQWIEAHPIAWTNAEARWSMNRVAPGIPAVELDENENPTGFLLLDHPDIDHRDVYIFKVVSAGIEFAKAQDAITPGAGAFLAAEQAEKDERRLRRLIKKMQDGELTYEQVDRRIWNEVKRQAATLGVEEYKEPEEP